MAVQPIRMFKDPVLKKKCSPVTVFDASLDQLARDMRDTMQYNRGVGLAAPQIGKPIALIVVQKQKTKGIHIVVNPEIVEQSQYMLTGKEGCLSYPGKFVEIERPSSVEVKGKNLCGEDITIHAVGLEARIFCHEIDHLQGRCRVAK